MYTFINPLRGNHDVSVELISECFQKLFQMYSSVVPTLDPEIFRYIEKNCKVVLFKKGAIMVDFGEINRYMLFPFTGLVRSNFILDGKLKTVWFSKPGDIVIAVDSWFDQLPSDERLTAIQDTLCLAMHFQEMEYICKKWPEFNMACRKITEVYLRQALQRTKWIHYKTMPLYRLIIKKHWNIAADLPMQEIANFLGISRETLSRNLNKKFKKS